MKRKRKTRTRKTISKNRKLLIIEGWAVLSTLILSILLFLVIRYQFSSYDYNNFNAVIASLLLVIATLPMHLIFLFFLKEKLMNNKHLEIKNHRRIETVIAFGLCIIVFLFAAVIAGYVRDRNDIIDRFIFDPIHKGWLVSLFSGIAVIVTWILNHIVVKSVR